MNSGKTLFMARQLFIHWLQGMTIITNINLTFPHQLVDKDFILWLAKEQPRLKDVAFGFDELWIWLDSRKFKKNTLATYFFNQSSKDDNPIYFTAQHNGQIEKRIRDNLHILTQCSRVLLINNKFVPINEEKRFLPKEYQSKLYIKVINFRRINIGYYTEMIPDNPFYIRADIFFRLYDTTEKIKSSGKVKPT